MTEQHPRAPRAPIVQRRQVPPRRSARAVLLCGLVALVAGVGVAALVAGGPGGSTATAAAPSGDALIRAAQRQLGVPADGVLGPATRAALRAFQQAGGLAVTGRLDEPTLVALGLAEQRLTVLDTTVASAAASEAMAERAAVTAAGDAPAETVPDAPAATTTTPAATAPAQTTPATTPEAPAEEDVEGPAAPVVGGALAGAPPPVVGGQVPDDAALSPVPPRRAERTGTGVPRPGGLSPRPPVPEEAPISPELRARLDRIARCESGGDPRAVSPGGRYRGKYQFSRATWRAVGGKGDPAAAPEAEQDRRAAILYRRTGPSSWPVCGRR